MSQKRIILSDSSLNRYGFRVLTSGMLIEAFKKNPVMLYMHFRDEGSPIWGDSKAIGHWEDIQLNGDELSQKQLPQNTKQGLTTLQASESALLLPQQTKIF